MTDQSNADENQFRQNVPGKCHQFSLEKNHLFIARHAKLDRNIDRPAGSRTRTGFVRTAAARIKRGAMNREVADGAIFPKDRCTDSMYFAECTYKSRSTEAGIQRAR